MCKNICLEYNHNAYIHKHNMLYTIVLLNFSKDPWPLLLFQILYKEKPGCVHVP